MIYSQAHSLFKSGFKHYFDLEEIAKINERNERFRNVSVIEELILDKYQPAIDANAAYRYYTASEILTELNSSDKINVTNHNIIQVGKILSKMGFTKKKKNSVYKYAMDQAQHVIDRKIGNVLGVKFQESDFDIEDLPF